MHRAAKESLKITFHNPNTTDELAKCLIKLIAREQVEILINKTISAKNNEGKQLDGVDDMVKSNLS